MQPLPSTTNPPSPARCAAAILEGTPALVWYVRRHMRRHRKGLSVPQFRALIKAESQAEVTLSDIAEHLTASLPTTSRLVANLVNRGYLTRRQSARDRRQVIIRPTSQGRAIAEAARQASLHQMATELEPMPDADRVTVIRALEILEKFIGGVRQPAALDGGRTGNTSERAGITPALSRSNPLSAPLRVTRPRRARIRA